MTVITNAELRVRENTVRGEIIRLMSLNELIDEGRKIEVEIHGTIIKPDNNKKSIINAWWEPDLNVLMPIGSSNFVDRFIICEAEIENKIWEVKYFENISKRKKVVLNETTTDIKTVKEWLDVKDCICIAAKYKGMLYKKYRIYAINEKVCYIQGNKLISYQI